MVKVSESSSDLGSGSTLRDSRQRESQLQRRGTMPHVISEGLERARALLESGHATDALRLLNSQRYASPVFDNARAVCLMRLGRPEQALQILRPLVLVNGAIGFRNHVPDIYKINLATALAMAGDVMAAHEILGELRDAEISHPQMTELRVALDRWQTGLSLWELFQWNLGARVHHRVILHFIPGLLD